MVVALAACGSALPGVIEALPAEVDGFERVDRSLDDDGQFAAALEAEGISRDAVAGHEARWGDEIRLIALRFEAVGLNEAYRVARSLVGIGEVEMNLALVGGGTAFELTGPTVEGVAYQFAVSGEGSESLMYTIIAPSAEEADPIARAIVDATPSQD